MIYLMVYTANGKHYASRFFNPGDANFLLGLSGGREIFTVEDENLTTLENKAREKAREQGISNVINLDN